MGQENSGLSNADYAAWMANVASDDCTEVEELYIKYTSGNATTYTQNTQICELMQGATEGQVAGYEEVKFSGTNGEGPWYAIDKRLTVNLERTVNYADVPANIKRPTGT